jgi:hypothetical protein
MSEDVPLRPGWTRCVCGQPIINSYNGWKQHTPWCPAFRRFVERRYGDVFTDAELLAEMRAEADSAETAKDPE